MEIYSFIYTPKHEHKNEDVLENYYNTIEKIRERFIVYDEKKNRYYVFDSFATYQHFAPDVKISDRCFHEVIFGRLPQKLKFDVDMDLQKIEQFEMQDSPGEISEITDVIIDDMEIYDFLDSIEIKELKTPSSIEMKAKHIIETIIQTIKDAFFLTYGMELDSIIVCESTNINIKYSYHLIIDKFFVDNNEEAKEFTYRFLKLLPQSYHSFVDKGVNKSLQNFRLVGCQKDNNQNRIKTITSDHDEFSTVITNVIDCSQLPSITSSVSKETLQITMPKEDFDAILKIARPHSNGHEFKSQYGNMFIYKRLRSTYCSFCERNHDSDNTFIVSIINTKGTITVFKSCRRFSEESKTNKETIQSTEKIGEFTSINVPVELVFDPNKAERKITQWMETGLTKTVDKIISTPSLIQSSQRTLFDKLPAEQKNVYCEKELKNFELKPTLCVKAHMKMGKTKKLKQFINLNFADTVAKQNIIRFVSFRQTFSSNIKERFEDFTLYSDVRGELTQKRLVIQVESLDRVVVDESTEYPDLLIMDECESIFEQFNSGLIRNFSRAFAVFQWLLRYSKYVVLMDANLSDRTFRILQRMRNEPIYYHCNAFKNATDDKYYFTTDEIKWLGILYSSIDKGEKIAIPMSSLTKAKIIQKNLLNKFPEKRIKLYSSETTNTEKKEHFGNVNLHWKYDVLIYTPTVSAGISFEAEHFDKVFGYFIDLSCCVETCIQMIGRIRNVKSKQLIIYLHGTSNNLPEEIDEIQRYVYQKRENLSKNFDDSLLQFEYGPFGEVKQYTTDYFYIWMENVRVRNLSLNSFVKRFINTVAYSGAQINQLTDEMFRTFTGELPTINGELIPMLEKIKEDHAAVKQEIKTESSTAIATARELNGEELEEIQTKMLQQQDISQEDKHAYDKYRLRNDYKYWNKEITDQFVSKYIDRRIRSTFKNTLRISSFNSIDEALAQIQREERANNIYIMEELDERSQANDVGRKYVFDRHRIALGFLKVCGFRNINDTKYVHRTILAENLKENESLIYDNLCVICVDLSLHRPRLALFKSIEIKDPEGTSEKDKGKNASAYISLMLKSINKVLSEMYGIKIVNPSLDDMYHIKQNSLFTLDPNDGTARPVLVQMNETPLPAEQIIVDNPLDL